MKKEYVNPEMQVVMLQTNAIILAGSDLGISSESVDNSSSDAATFFDNGGSEEW